MKKEITIDEIKNSENYKAVTKIIKENRFIKKRISLLNQLNLTAICKSVGSGGVGRIIKRKSGYYVQISSGLSQHNYAYITKIS